MAKKKQEDASTNKTPIITEKLTLNGESKFRFHNIPLRVKCLNEKQKELKKSIEDYEITISFGSAGTGKTYLSLLTALHTMKLHIQYKKLILVKSLTYIEGENPGFLPGSLKEKIEPNMYSFTGNLDKIFGDKKVTKELFDKEIIEFAPLAYIRGITWDNAIIIIDEAQNIDMHTFKTIATRIGTDCKMIFLGDIEQIDKKDKEKSALKRVLEIFKSEDYVGTVEFTEDDCVRNPIITKILKRMNEFNY